MLLLCLPLVSAFEYIIETVPYCEGNIRIADRTKYDGVYAIKDCAWENNMWICPCKPLPKELVLVYENEKEERYSFVIEYYIGPPKDENNKRTYSHEGLMLKGVKEPETFKLPNISPSSKTYLITAIVLVGLIILGGIGFMLKRFFDKGWQEDTSDYPIQKQEEDISNILERYK